MALGKGSVMDLAIARALGLEFEKESAWQSVTEFALE